MVKIPELEKYKIDFLDALYTAGALKLGTDSGGDYTLKAKRLAPHFISIGELNDGVATNLLGETYAIALNEVLTEEEYDLLYGIPQKGIPIVISTSMKLKELFGINKPWFYTRPEGDEKTYGEKTQDTEKELSDAEERKAKLKSLVVGREPEEGKNTRVVLFDDVLSTGGAKYGAKKLLSSLVDDINYAALAILVDRQEVSTNGKGAVEEFKENTNIPIISGITVLDIYKYFKTKPEVNQDALKRMENYLRVYGTEEAREYVGKIPEQIIIDRNKSVTVACDVPTVEAFEELIEETHDVDGIEGYKVGFELMLKEGLGKVVESKRNEGRKIYYNHLGGATDIPDVAENFMKQCKDGGVDGVVLSFFSGPATAKAWVEAADKYDIEIIAESLMGHNGFLEEDSGFISKDTSKEMHRYLTELGVTKFILPEADKNTNEHVKDAIKENEEILSELGADILYRPYDKEVKGANFDEITAPEVMEVGLKSIVKIAQQHTTKPIIYDHQKAGNNTPASAKPFAEACKNAGVDGVIIFPQAGPESERAYIYQLLNQDLNVIVGGVMTHPKYLASDEGFISDEGAYKIYEIAAEMGVNNFVAPGNNIPRLKRIKEIVETEGITPTVHSPGLITQDGDIKESASIFEKFNGIIGRGIYGAKKIHEAAINATSKL